MIKIIEKRATSRAGLKIQEQVGNAKEAKKVQLPKAEVSRVHLRCR